MVCHNGSMPAAWCRVPGASTHTLQPTTGTPPTSHCTWWSDESWKLTAPSSAAPRSFGKTYIGKYSDSVPNAQEFYTSASVYDELAVAALWLYRATGEDGFKDDAYRFMAQHLGSEGSPWNTFDWGTSSFAASMLFAQLFKDPAHTSRIQVRDTCLPATPPLAVVDKVELWPQ
jgi:hypothetical protein